MKITVVSPNEGRDVRQPHLDKLLPALQERGYSLEFVGWDRLRRWPRRSTHDGVAYTMILRGGGYSSRRLLLWMPVWYLVTALQLARRPPRADEVLMAIDFEGAAPAAIAAWLRGHRFVYNCRDNISMRYRLPGVARALLDRLDLRVMRRADAVIFPDETRVPPGAPDNVVIVRNCAPEVALRRRTDPGTLTVLATGNLREDRGVGMLLDAVEEVEDCRVLAAGKCRDRQLATRLARSPNVDYRGLLPPTQGLELCGEADVVFTFYAPTLEINRRAVSNKWSDAMMASLPILVNSEVQKSRWIEDEAIGYACPYDRGELARMLRHISRDRAEAAARGARGRELWEAGYRWDVQEQRVVDVIEQTARRAASS